MDATDAELIGRRIDEDFELVVASALLTGYNGSTGLYASDEELERAADLAVRLRAKVRRARRVQS